MRRAPLALVFALVGASVLLIGVALLRGGELLPTLPVARAVYSATVPPSTAEDSDLGRAGYVLEKTEMRPSRPLESGRTQRTYVFQGASGSSVVLRDDEYPSSISIPRELALEMRFSVKGGKSQEDVAEITPGLVAAAEKAVREDPAIAAGLEYLVKAGGSTIRTEALRNAVIDYLQQQYRQPSTSLREACAGCAAKDGYGDAYSGGSDLHTPLRRGWPGWEIAGIRHYLDGESTFTVALTTRVTRTRS
jgi:hypothetical protein